MEPPMMVYRTELTFVLLNRAGLVCSPGTGILEDSDGFTGALASPRMLDHSDEGYDMTSIVEPSGGSSKYHIDPPESTFPGPKASPSVTTLSSRPDLDSPLWAKVREKWCHKKICGRATILSRLRGLRSSHNSHSNNRDLNNFTKGTMAICGAGTRRKRSYDEIDKPAGFVSKFVCGPGSDSGEVIKPLRVPLGAAKDARRFVIAVLDIVLSYWRLVNLGILHPDFGFDVTILNTGQTSKWQVLQTGEPGPRDKLAESKEKLRAIPDELHRHPKAMVYDFDLPRTHSLVLKSSNPQNLARDLLGENKVADSKRCRTSLSTRVRCGDANSGFSQTLDEGLGILGQVSLMSQLLGFQTEAPAFMSWGVLKARLVGKNRYDYIDDLEFLFWVILWSVAAHLDRLGAQTTVDAQGVLDSMDQLEFSQLASWKHGQLGYCAKGALMEAQLKGFGNAWASDPVFVNTFIPFGKYLWDVREKISDPLSARSVAIVFSDVVNIIRSALASGA